jgi:hypothetical protein
LGVIIPPQTLQILDAVVCFSSIDVVDFVSVWDRPVSVFPYSSVLELVPIFSVFNPSQHPISVVTISTGIVFWSPFKIGSTRFIAEDSFVPGTPVFLNTSARSAHEQ